MKSNKNKNLQYSLDTGLKNWESLLTPDIEFLDNNGDIIPFSEQLAIFTHYLSLKGTQNAERLKKQAIKLINLWTKRPNNSEISGENDCVSESPLEYSLFNNLYTAPFPGPKDEKFTFIDLFAGIGGFRMALQELGGKCVFSSEWDINAQKTYFANYGEIPFGDITLERTKSYIPDNFDILCAGFPCQPFSICGKKMGFDDTRGTLFFDVCQIIKDKQPNVVILENVKHLINHDKKRTFNVILNSLKELGYNTSYKVLNSSNFGVPQSRERIIIVATKYGTFDFNDLTESKSGNIRDILVTDGDFEYLNPGEFTILDSSVIKEQPSGLIFCGYRNKGTWKKGTRPNTEHLSRCHRQPNRIYSVNGIHPTLPSQETSGRFWIYIPEKDSVRKLQIKECYKLMGYPESFIINPNKGNAYKQCGNSVVVPMIYELGKSIIRQGFNNNEHGKFRTNY